jgi:hypothetical protein
VALYQRESALSYPRSGSGVARSMSIVPESALGAADWGSWSSMRELELDAIEESNAWLQPHLISIGPSTRLGSGWL